MGNPHKKVMPSKFTFQKDRFPKELLNQLSPAYRSVNNLDESSLVGNRAKVFNIVKSAGAPVCSNDIQLMWYEQYGEIPKKGSVTGSLTTLFQQGYLNRDEQSRYTVVAGKK